MLYTVTCKIYRLLPTMVPKNTVYVFPSALNRGPLAHGTSLGGQYGESGVWTCPFPSALDRGPLAHVAVGFMIKDEEFPSALDRGPLAHVSIVEHIKPGVLVSIRSSSRPPRIQRWL